MKFLQYLNEQVKYVSPRDLPNWVQKTLKGKKIGKEIEVVIGDTVSIGGNWHDANVMDVFLYDKGRIVSQKAIGGLNVGDSKREVQVKKGFTTKLTQDKMVLITNTYPKKATLYVHPNAMIKSLEEPKQNIQPQEYIALAATRGLKASYAGGKPRVEACREYGIDYETVKMQLISKGLLNKNGAINKNGKNALIDMFDDAFIRYERK